jgi:hypothetical protein
MTLRQRWNRTKDWWSRQSGIVLLTLSFQFVILLTTIGYVVVAKHQLNEMSAANGISREALNSVQRAFIYNSGFKLRSDQHPVGDDKDVPIIGLETQFENSGATPGTQVVEETNVCMQKGSDIDEDFNYRDLHNTQNVFAMIGPRTGFSSFYHLEPEQVDAIMKSKTNLFVWGWVKYLDIFGDSHTTEFCKKYFGFTKQQGATDRADFDVHFTQCPKHNCADDGCRNEKLGTDWSIECENVDTSLH